MSDATTRPNAAAAGRFTFPGTSISVNRMGYGAMQLAGPHVFGEPRDPEEARAVLQEARRLGIDHIDTSDFYGPHVTNRLIREALHPYDADLAIVTKVGAYRDETGGWILQRDADFLRRSVEDNLRNLGLDRMAVVNLRMGAPEDDVAAPMEAMRRMQQEGLLKHIGISTVDERQLAIAREIAPIVCVQNHYNLVHRTDDAMIDALAADGIAYVPYFPLGGFTLLQTDRLTAVAASIGETSQAVALAWLLQRSPNILVIPGTSRRAHLHANVAAASLQLSAEHVRQLDGLLDAG
ncbi:oxidoreductase [Aureimonas phyllosphaerae]|uniref:Aryl-alcohol dehydrogenase-like predicted oxidoreductase n=1 Tax=Aureimonas phyllosphaerae TaxID=1166078 RepID=A0A7W6FSM7_9HYPH|nr:oxidoreductase [Aureimonas phyllosphaerae]MBB3934143.1 aryl-alcohol dehydrogenase-like predicted oxidoreductase [Aureimonas phyllosphaerae]MBB3958641.1 aryl-alcohol dehydrogenase-like predicted oxidoreductase [Aureimonas phyllosphaerae]SFF00043.1 Predicted oxidoreductase [Aureimonas phyllosphaerae]